MSEPPASVWFGPAVTGSEFREFTGFLGTHNGVAVLEWPRDERFASPMAALGLPRLFRVGARADSLPARSALQEWVLRGTTVVRTSVSWR